MSYKKVKKSTLVEKPVSGLHVEANNRNMQRDFPRLGMSNVYLAQGAKASAPKTEGQGNC